MTAVSIQTLPDGRVNVQTCQGYGRVYRPAALKRLIRMLVKQGNRKTRLHGFGMVSARDLQDFLG